MPQQDIITIADFVPAHMPALVDLLYEQEVRLWRQNSLIARARTREQIEGALNDEQAIKGDEKRGWVALDVKGRVRGFVRAAIWELDERSILLSFLTRRNGVTEWLALPDPADEDAREVFGALFAKLDVYWRASGTSGDLLRWPSVDSLFDDVLARYAFRLDSVCAFRSLRPSFAAGFPLSTQQHLRLAQAADEQELVALFHEELRFHEQYTPFVHASPTVLEAFRRKLQRAWLQEQPRLGEPFVLVIEQGGSIIAMAENTLIEITPADEPGFTPSGHYCCIDNVSVQRDFQGQGLGHALLQGISDIVQPLQSSLRGYVLWYNPDNPKAARFWMRQGFQALWTTYQRLHA